MSKTSFCLHCGSPIISTGPGQPRKFCNDAHKKAFTRSGAQIHPNATQPTPPHPSEQPKPLSHNYLTPEPPTREQLLENCWKYLPPHIAAYLPVQPGQSIADLQSFHPEQPKPPTKTYQLNPPPTTTFAPPLHP